MEENFKDTFMVCELNFIHLYDDDDRCLIFNAEFDTLGEAEKFIEESKSDGILFYILPLKKYKGPKR